MGTMFCKTCGGTTLREGNYDVCEFCGNRWEREGSDTLTVEREKAWDALREGDFDTSSRLFERILESAPLDHEAHWGRALAINGILYITDYTGRRVPTCNNITSRPFTEGRDVSLAIENAPGEIAAGYREQAAYIEAVRAEWFSKAAKEPPFDVFISYKESDRENGIARTPDSYDAQELYHALEAEGYRVFFSRVSLREKVSEHYEPYIYAALNSAKVMIVFGEKPEHFSAVWVKNEWMRFQNRIERGEKHPHSLVVVYKDMDPYDLPAPLRARQALNYSDLTLLRTLTAHIARIKGEASGAAVGETHSPAFTAPLTTAPSPAAQNTPATGVKTAPRCGLVFASNGDGTCTLTDIGTCTDADVTVPATSPAGERVTRIGKGVFAGDAWMTSITLPEGITHIGAEAFYGCKRLRAITLGCPVGWRVLSTTADTKGTALDAAALADKASAAKYLFDTYSHYAWERSPETGGKTARNTDGTGLAFTSNGDGTCTVKGMGSCTAGELVIPATSPAGERVVAIGKDAFHFAKSLTAVVLPNTLTRIEKNAFFSCKRLALVTLPPSLLSIGEWAFGDCKALTAITLPPSLEAIGKYAFFSCKALSAATFENPTGWSYSKKPEGDAGKPIDRNTLADKAGAAKALKGGIGAYHWKRN